MVFFDKFTMFSKGLTIKYSGGGWRDKSNKKNPALRNDLFFLHFVHVSMGQIVNNLILFSLKMKNIYFFFHWKTKQLFFSKITLPQRWILNGRPLKVLKHLFLTYFWWDYHPWKICKYILSIYRGFASFRGFAQFKNTS